MWPDRKCDSGGRESLSGGRTLAVMPSGFDNQWPSIATAKSGAAVGEAGDAASSATAARMFDDASTDRLVTDRRERIAAMAHRLRWRHRGAIRRKQATAREPPLRRSATRPG
jgi:hypothetical protein